MVISVPSVYGGQSNFTAQVVQQIREANISPGWRRAFVAEGLL